MSRRSLRIAGLVALALVPAPAPAGAAEVGRQVERRAPARYPADLGGCRPRCVRGGTIQRGAVLLSRTVRLAPGERRVRTAFRCPGRRRFRTFGHLESGQVGIDIASDQLPYTRRSRVRVAGVRLLAPVRNPASGTLYALCVPR